MPKMEGKTQDGRDLVYFNPNSQEMEDLVNKILKLLQDASASPAEAMVACQIAADYLQKEYEIQHVCHIPDSPVKQ